jgi:hypothetical protein
MCYSEQRNQWNRQRVILLLYRPIGHPTGYIAPLPVNNAGEGGFCLYLVLYIVKSLVREGILNPALFRSCLLH